MRKMYTAILLFAFMAMAALLFTSAKVQACGSTTTFQQIGLASDAKGTVLVVDGSSYTYATLPANFNWASGSKHNITATTQILVGTNKRYVWLNWTG